MKQLASVVVGLIGIALIYGAVNLVVVGGQKLLKHDDEVRLDLLKKDLEAERRTIEEKELELQSLDRRLDDAQGQLGVLKASIRSIEQRYPYGIPTGMYAGYSKQVNDYNAWVSTYNNDLARREAVYADYSQRVDRYNARVEEANALAKKIGSTWYVVPRPRAGG